MNLLPVQRAAQLSPSAPQTRWLIEGLWADQAVGILGGEPKCYKTFLALDIALSVASGTACLRQFPVRQQGPVLFFPAEDLLSDVRARLDGICAAANISLATLPLHVITAPSLRLDLPADCQRLTNTVASLKPRLLILDPLIRLHGRDENDASQIAPLLGFLRQLQRRFQLAVLVVHHAKKDAHSLRPGQALRGSSELHGWGDCNLYLRRFRDRLTLSTEHRAAPSQDGIPLQLVHSEPALALAVLSAPPPAPKAPDPLQRVSEILAELNAPISFRQLRKLCAIRAQSLNALLAQLIDQGRVQRRDTGFSWIPSTPTASTQTVSQLSLSMQPPGNANGKRFSSSGG